MLRYPTQTQAVAAPQTVGLLAGAVTVLLPFVLVAGCSGPSGMTTQSSDPIRVLMVTATHDYRHEEAIASQKTFAAAISEGAEFDVVVTEDVADLSDENLAAYDVLFFANSTLRAADDISATEAVAADPMDGTWGNYDLEYESRRGPGKGELALSGTPGALTGNIMTAGAVQPTELTEVTLDGDALTFGWPAGNFGSFTVTATISGDDLTGTMKFRDRENPITGKRTGPAAAVETTDEPRVTAAQRAAIASFVASGKGVAVAHAGLDALYEWDEYRVMVGGGLFEEHPWNQEVRLVVEEPDNPAVAHLGEDFTIHDEIYVLKENPRWNSRVLASLDMKSVGVESEPAGGESNDHPISWIRKHNGGRVFVTKLGHSAEVWENVAYQEHILQGLRMVAGRTEADFGGYRVKDVLAENVWPDDIAVDEEGDVWIVELRGKVHHYDSETGETRLLAEIQTTEPTGIEHGIYGVEVDPNFYTGEPYVYIFMAEPETFINTLYRYEYRDGTLDFSTEKVLLRVPTEPQCCHQAGDLEWGPDGTLYVSTGDTGYSGTRPEWGISEERVEAFKAQYGLSDHHWSRLVDSERTSQNLADLRGKILRINKDGSIPKDNPFYGQPGVRWEIYAYGLRNPYRFKVDHETGALYIGVVGPDAAYDYDEYDVSEKGGENFGWPRSIGTLFYNEWAPDMIPNYVPPLWEYSYETGGRSATVGPIYRFDGAGAFPEIFQDKIFVYDWSRRWIKWAEVEEGTFSNATEKDHKHDPLTVNLPAKRFVNVKLFDQLTLTTPISMELGPDGALYVAEYDGFWDPGPNARLTRYRWVTDE